MPFRRDRALADLCADLSTAAIRREQKAAAKAMRAISAAGEGAGADDLTDGLSRLTLALTQVSLTDGGPIARVAYTLIEWGGDPFAVLDGLVERVARGLERGDAAVELWRPALDLALQQKPVRLGLPQRDRLTAAAADAPYLLGLLRVLDDEELIVVDRASGRVYAASISGIADNFQLYTLLADSLIGDPVAGFIAGQPPDADWVAAATIGEELTPPGGILGRFDLVDAEGQLIPAASRPADIAIVTQHRLVVVEPARHQQVWPRGRTYPLMTPEFRVDRLLSESAGAHWLARIE